MVDKMIKTSLYWFCHFPFIYEDITKKKKKRKKLKDAINGDKGCIYERK